MTSGTRLAIGGLLIATATTYMGYLGASSSWQYYLTVDEFLREAPALGGLRLRVSGTIANDSLLIPADRNRATFWLEGTSKNLMVALRGSPPDNLAEKMEVVVEGRIVDSSYLQAERVLTRCASKYAPQQRIAARYAREPPATGGQL